MKSMIRIVAMLALAVRVVPLAGATDLPPDAGSVRIIVKDAEGKFVAQAPIYLQVGEQIRCYKANPQGYVVLTLPAGQYSVSSAMTRPVVDGILRFASPDAQFFVPANDATTLILTLHPLDFRIEDLSANTLEKIGVAAEVQKYLN